MASKIFHKLTIRKKSTVLLPGGNSPKIFYGKLIHFDVDWHNISLMASDERVVSLSSDNSNTGLIQRELLDYISNKTKPKLIKLYPINNHDIEAQLELLDIYLSNNTPEIAFLGIGKDGHTAGIFKEKITTNNCYLVKNKIDPYYRITISMKMLMKIPYLIFFVFGSEKRESLEKILLNKDSEKFIPARFLLKNGLGEKIILCDNKAAPTKFNLGESIISL